MEHLWQCGNACTRQADMRGRWHAELPKHARCDDLAAKAQPDAKDAAPIMASQCHARRREVNTNPPRGYGPGHIPPTTNIRIPMSRACNEARERDMLRVSNNNAPQIVVNHTKIRVLGNPATRPVQEAATLS